MNYYINADKSQVEAWSTIRLPFEPKGWMLDMRNSLKHAVKKLESDESTGLYAEYTSNERDLCDVENILIYNVGTGTFRNLCRRNLCFERRISAVPPAPLADTKMNHYYSYSIVNNPNAFKVWKKKDGLASFDDVTCPSLKGSNKPHRYWYAMKNANITVSTENAITQKFGIQLHVKSPVGTTVNLVCAIKPLLDGVISAFHVSQQLPDNLTLERLANSLKQKVNEIKELLMDSRYAVLGSRNLVTSYRKGIKWNPADDLCLTVEITIDDCLDSSEWWMSRQLFSIEEI